MFTIGCQNEMGINLLNEYISALKRHKNFAACANKAMG